jgi:hypothetical protein
VRSRISCPTRTAQAVSYIEGREAQRTSSQAPVKFELNCFSKAWRTPSSFSPIVFWFPAEVLADLSLRDSRQRHRGGIKVEHRARHSPAIRGGGRLAFQLSEITLQECGIDARSHDPSRSEIPLPPLFIERIINGSPRTGIS